jgi:hypothetical protein
VYYCCSGCHGYCYVLPSYWLPWLLFMYSLVTGYCCYVASLAQSIETNKRVCHERIVDRHIK